MKLNVVELSKVKDFKAKVLKDIGAIVAKPAAKGGLDLHGSNVLVANYIAPEVTKGGIYRPDPHLYQDIYQGKVGLILKMGEDAFAYADGQFKWKGTKPGIGDYVMYRASDGANRLNFRGFSLSIVDSSLIRMTVGDPEDIY